MIADREIGVHRIKANRRVSDPLHLSGRAVQSGDLEFLSSCMSNREHLVRRADEATKIVASYCPFVAAIHHYTPQFTQRLEP